MSNINKNSIEKVINKHFNTLEDKINNLSQSTENEIYSELKLKMKKSELQVDKILKCYDKLSKNELTLEEKYIFAITLINIFKNANNRYNIYQSFNVDKIKVNNAIELMISSDIHDKVIGIDNFIALSHSNSALLPDLIALINGITVLYEVSNSKFEDEIIDYYFKWRENVSDKIVEKLNEIRNRKGLSRFKYEYM